MLPKYNENCPTSAGVSLLCVFSVYHRALHLGIDWNGHSILPLLDHTSCPLGASSTATVRTSIASKCLHHRPIVLSQYCVPLREGARKAPWHRLQLAPTLCVTAQLITPWLCRGVLRPRLASFISLGRGYFLHDNPARMPPRDAERARGQQYSCRRKALVCGSEQRGSRYGRKSPGSGGRKSRHSGTVVHMDRWRAGAAACGK